MVRGNKKVDNPWSRQHSYRATELIFKISLFTINPSYPGLTRDEIVGNSIIMILASFENVANTMMYLSYCIASYDGVQERLNDELQQALDKNDVNL